VPFRLLEDPDQRASLTRLGFWGLSGLGTELKDWIPWLLRSGFRGFATHGDWIADHSEAVQDLLKDKRLGLWAQGLNEVSDGLGRRALAKTGIPILRPKWGGALLDLLEKLDSQDHWEHFRWQWQAYLDEHAELPPKWRVEPLVREILSRVKEDQSLGRTTRFWLARRLRAGGVMPYLKDLSPQELRLLLETLSHKIRNGDAQSLLELARRTVSN